MIKNKHLKRRLFNLVLLPCVIALAILTSSHYLIHEQFIAKNLQLRQQFIYSLFEDINGYPLVDSQLLNRLSHALLVLDSFQSIAALDAQGNVIWHRGIPLSHADKQMFDAARKNHEHHSGYCSGGTCLTLIPANSSLIIETGNSHSKVSEFVVATNDTRAIISSYQSAIAILCTIAICLLVATFYVRKFQNTILSPLEKIHVGIQDYLKGRFERAIPASEDKVYDNLINDINQLATLQKKAQDTLHQSIEQSTAELRETLETVEIQNIELDIARKSALQASRVKSEFLANTSHEIRTPLNGIIGFAELLQKTELNPQQAEYLETIDESAKGLLTIINDILDFSRLEIGKLTLEYKPVRLRQVIEEALRLQAPAAHEKKLRLLTIIDHEIPEHLLGDPLRLKQVLSNLLNNSIKFTNTGHILVSVSKEDRADNQITLNFRITDSGIGLNPDQQEQLFDAFTQLDASENRAQGGTGLGLAIAKGLVNRMNGQIGVESEPGKGATFWFTSTLGRNPNAANAKGYLTGTLRNIRIISYDCSTMSRTEITHYLRGWGAEVTEISRFKDIELVAQTTCRTGPIHLAVLDAQVNDKTFDKVKLRKTIDMLNKDFSIPVIVLASPAVQRLIEPSLAGTHCAIIQRPVLCNRLHQSVCEQLGIIIPDTESDLPAKTSKAISNSKQINILAVDDNPANLRLVSELLKGIDVNVVTADGGEKALKLCLESAFDLIIMDIQMPGMDGLETTRHIRRNENPERRTPIVALTAHAVNDQKSRLLLAGMDDYLTKPVNENELLHIINRWVTRNGIKKQKGQPDTQPQKPNTALEPEAGTSINSEPTRKDMVLEKMVLEELALEEIATTEISPDYQAPVRQDKLVDLQLSLELAKNNSSLARDMLVMLLDSLTETREQINTYFGEGNLKELQEVIHKLHGGCCYCGVPKLKKHSANLDKKLKDALDNNHSSVAFEDEINALVNVIDEVLDWKESLDINALFEDTETT